MSTPDTPADTPAVISAPKRRQRVLTRLLAPVVPIVALVGGGTYAYTAGLLPFGAARHGLVAHAVPQRALDVGSTPDHPRYRTSYLKIDGPFTTNLEGSTRFVQVEIGVATNYDPAVLAHLQTHELPIRSAVLGILAQQSETTIGSPAGRLALQRQLKTAINHVLEEKEGFGGISDVYLTGLIIQ